MLRDLIPTLVVLGAGCGFEIKSATIDAPADANLCFDGFPRICLAALPTTPLAIATGLVINTDERSGCAETTQGTGTGVCVVAATTINVATGITLRATGAEPLVLLASESIEINGLVSVVGLGSAGADSADCGTVVAPLEGSGGGGAGGSFGGSGGRGGATQINPGGLPAPAITATPTALRGGCNGHVAGRAYGGAGGRGGHGGGAVALIAPTIAILGRVDASGTSGAGGTDGDAGGGGGGSGGMIALSGVLSIGGYVTAQGGAGGGGSSDSSPGMPGGAAPAPGSPAPGGDCAQPGNGGRGGDGGTLADAGSGQDTTGTGGGGGGGGAGVVIVIGPITVPGLIVPAPR